MNDSVVFTGGPIETFGPGPQPEAVLVEDGVIRSIGTRSDCLAEAASTPRRVDMDGRTLFPGFVDAHMHLLLHGCRLDWADLSSARSIEDVLRLLKEYASAHPDAPSVDGYGYDQTVLAEGRHPTAADLDRVDPSRSVTVQHVSGHGYVVSSATMRALGITAATPTPSGGRMDRDATGAPTGLFFDAACDLLTGEGGVKIRNHGPNFHLPMAPADLRRRFELAQESFLSVGVTTVCDAQVTSRELAAYFLARDEGSLLLRTHALLLSSGLEHLREIGLSSKIGDDRLEISGVKFYADGSVLARTAFLAGECCGHSDGEGRSGDGYLYHDPRELHDLLVEAHRLGLVTATHSQGSVPIGMVLDAIAAARAEIARPDVAHRIEHCGFPTDEQIARMATLNVVPVAQPVQLHEHADTIVEDLGPIGARFYPYGAFRRAGLPVVISSDAPVTDPRPLQAAWAAITRQTVSGAVAGPEFTVDRKTALTGLTSTPASLLGRRDVGFIAEGAAADLVLLDDDPSTVDVAALPNVGVTETWIGGARVWSR
ncbi:MAG TPA: amidohydrolase [Acidimicrobiales bacterium]|nr:amidohydrolase [Acidimicrobiales bacterium]